MTLLVSFNLTNTGKRVGDDVAQMYVREETASVETPVEALKGFQRVHLEPGQTKRITVHLKQSNLAVCGMDRKWEVELGTFKVIVGGSSAGGLSASSTLK